MLRGFRALYSSRNFTHASRRQHSNNPKISSTSQLINSWRQKFEELRIPEEKSSLDNILGHILNQKIVNGLSERKDLHLTPDQGNDFERLCHCRVARMPIQYIVGEWEFRDLCLRMQPPVFIPRPETEELVELILRRYNPREKLNFLEIGCGSGAISLALLSSLPLTRGVAVDQSSTACVLTLKNAINNKLSDRISVTQLKITESIKDDDFLDKFDFIVSNPPYVPSRDLMKLEPEIRLYEDLRALDGGEDGTNVIKCVLKVASKFLKDDGTLWLEVDSSHPDLIVRYLDIHSSTLKLKFVATYRDIFQKERFIEIKRDPEI